MMQALVYWGPRKDISIDINFKHHIILIVKNEEIAFFISHLMYGLQALEIKILVVEHYGVVQWYGTPDWCGMLIFRSWGLRSHYKWSKTTCRFWCCTIMCNIYEKNFKFRIMSYFYSNYLFLTSYNNLNLWQSLRKGPTWDTISKFSFCHQTKVLFLIFKMSHKSPTESTTSEVMATAMH